MMTPLRWFVAAMLACAIALLLFAAAKAHAQQSQCGPHEEIVKVLSSKFLEARRGAGTIGDQALAEFFVSEKRTWSLLVTNAGGMSCVIAAGDNWETDEAKAIGPSL